MVGRWQVPRWSARSGGKPGDQLQSRDLMHWKAVAILYSPWIPPTLASSVVQYCRCRCTSREQQVQTIPHHTYLSTYLKVLTSGTHQLTIGPNKRHRKPNRRDHHARPFLVADNDRDIDGPLPATIKRFQADASTYYSSPLRSPCHRAACKAIKFRLSNARRH